MTRHTLSYHKWFLVKHTRFILLIFINLFLIQSISFADVVKPALIEIQADTKGKITIEIRASIEALLTGINSRYQNTKDAPNAKEYDTLRMLKPEILRTKFNSFFDFFIKQIYLKVDEKKVTLSLSSITIPEVGYPKVPRISLITLSGKISPHSQNLIWYYPGKFGNNAVRVKQVNQQKKQWHWSEWQWLRHNKTSENFSLNQLFKTKPVIDTIQLYTALGFEHIFPKGVDHILFILGIFLFSLKLRPLLLQVTMFTVAHTITLGLSMNQIVSLPANIVEPLIALSIAYIGFENIWQKKLPTHRLILVFLFGLLHGLGFASVLGDFGMPADAFMTALISFNIGVELGQLFIIVMAFLIIGLWFKNKAWYHTIIVIPSSVMIMLTGLYWTLDRALLL